MRKAESSGLEKSLAIIFGISIIAGLFFLSPNLTGNAIANASSTSSTLIGAFLFVFGLFGIFWTVNKK